MESILSNSDYTFVASTKKITLVAPFNTLDEERILRITNLTTKAIIYDSERRTHPISMAAGVITHTYDATGMANGDVLQIIVDVLTDKSADTVQDWTAVAQNAIVKSTECDLQGVHKSILHLQAGLDTTTAHTGTRFAVQISGSATGDENWQDHAEFVALIGTAATDAIEDAPLAAGSTAIAFTGHALTVLAKWLMIKDATLINSELVMESAQTANEVVILDGTTNAHVATTPIWNVAITQNITLPKEAVRARVLVDNTDDDNGSTLVYKLDITKTVAI